MIKKLLFIFITVFAFSNISAQNIVIENGGTDCGTAINEFELIGTLNSKNQYQRLTTPTALGDSFGATGGTANVLIAFNGTDWVLYQNLIGNVIFIQEDHTAGLLPPDTGWIGDGTPCSSTATVEILTGGVLDLEKESLDSEVSIFPNPSSDFISITNLKESVHYKITSITGKTVMSNFVDTNNNQIDIKGLSKGFYFLEIEGKKTIKLIKK